MIRRVAGGVVTLVFAVLLVLCWPSRMGGSTAYVIVSGTSMQPALHTGDVVMVRTASHYAVGDVIAYRVPKGEAGAGGMVIHRVVGYDGDALITRGDNRAGADGWRPRPSDVVGRRVLLLPRAGRVFAVIAGPLMLAAIAAFAVTWYVWPSEDADRDEAQATGDDRSDRIEPSAVRSM